MNDESRVDLEVKITRLLDGELSSDERAELERELLLDPAAHAMLRDATALDERCRDALDAALAGGGGATVLARRRALRTVGAVAAAAAAAVLAVVLWSVFHDRPGPAVPGPAPEVAVDPHPPTPTTGRTVELVSDEFDPTPPPAARVTPVRRVDRFPVGLFDAESGQFRVIQVERERTQIQPAWLDL